MSVDSASNLAVHLGACAFRSCDGKKPLTEDLLVSQSRAHKGARGCTQELRLRAEKLEPQPPPNQTFVPCRKYEASLPREQQKAPWQEFGEKAAPLFTITDVLLLSFCCMLPIAAVRFSTQIQGPLFPNTDMHSQSKDRTHNFEK